MSKVSVLHQNDFLHICRNAQSLKCVSGYVSYGAWSRISVLVNELSCRFTQVRYKNPSTWPFFHHHLYSAAGQEYWSTKAADRFSFLDHLYPQPCVQDLTAARHAIDDELSALQVIMCSMRTRRNNFSLIGRLPPEILSRIVSFHAINQPTPRDPIFDPDDPFSSSSSPIRFRLGWITVTHVCHRWRQVALSDPNLWRTVVFDLGVAWAEEMLARSKAVLISYSRDLPFQPRRVSRRRTLDDEVTLRKHLSHVQQLVLSGHPAALAPAVRALTTPAPHLESLELLRNEPQSRESCITLPSDLFAHDAPKLRHLTLFGCAVPWDSPLFRDLTRLDIRIPPVDPFPRSAPAAQSDRLSIPTFDRLLSILEAMPSLQVLTLGNCLPRPESTSRIVPLRHMSKLSLDGSLSEVVAVLGRVSLPSSASLSFRCSGHNPLDGLLDTLVSFLASHFSSPETHISPLSTMIINEADLGASFRIMVWDTDFPLDQPESIPSAPARLHLTFGRQWAVVESLPLQVCKALPLRDLHTLSITYPEGPWSAADWADVCSHCPNVTHLRVRGHWAFTLAPKLKKRKTFPSLVTLSLHDIDFVFPMSPRQTDSESLDVVLPVILRKRRNAGIPVRRVNVTSCVVDDMWIEVLRGIVDDVVWDFDPGDYTDSQPSSAVDYDS
jgi:F-box-like